MQQLLWLETLLKRAGGLSLLVAPVTLSRLLGLPLPGSSFWPRLLGAVLCGLAAATFIEGTRPGAGGLGIVGSVAINLTAAGVIGLLAGLGLGAETRRGRLVLWGLVLLLVVLVLFEIAAA